MNPPSDAPSRRSVSSLALWSAPVVALAVAAPAASASGPAALDAEQPGWNVAARSGRGISSGGLTGYTGFAFEETAGLVPAPVVSFVETVVIIVTANWGSPASAQAGRDAAAVTARAVMTAVLIPPRQQTPGVGVGAWSVVGPTDVGLTLELRDSIGGTDDSGYLQRIRWQATRTVEVASLGASGQAGYSVVADCQKPYGSLFTSLDISLAPVAGSGSVAGDDSPGLQGIVTEAPRPTGPVLFPSP